MEIKNEKFEKFLVEDPNLCQFNGKMFHVWDGNHCFQAWRLYIDTNHPNEPNKHIKVNSFVLDTNIGTVELLTAMTDIKK